MMKKSTLWIEKEFLLMNWISLTITHHVHIQQQNKTKISLKLVAVFYDNLLISCLFSLRSLFENDIVSIWAISYFGSIQFDFRMIQSDPDSDFIYFFTTFYPFFLSGTDFFVGCLDKKKILFFHVFFTQHLIINIKNKVSYSKQTRREWQIIQ